MAPNRSSSKDKGPLRHAWKNWKNLQDQVAAFLACDQVKLALKDDEFRTKQFGDPWEKPPKGVDIDLIRKMWDVKPIRDLRTLAVALLAMSNQTQKHLAIKKAQTGMRETSQMQEWMNLLLDGETPRGHFKVLDVVIPDTVRSIDGFRIHAVVAIEILLNITKDELDPKAKDRIVTKTHGLHVVGTDQNTERARNMEMRQVGRKCQAEKCVSALR